MPTEIWKSWLLKVGVVSRADWKLFMVQGGGGFTTNRETASDPGITWAESSWCLGGCCGKYHLLLPLFSLLLSPPLKDIRVDGPSVWCIPATPALLCCDLSWNWKSDWVRCRKDGRLHQRENQSKLGTHTLKTEEMQCSHVLCWTVSASNTNSVFNIQVASLLTIKVNCLLIFSAI